MAWWHCCDINRRQFAFRLLCSHVSTYTGCLLFTVCYKAGFSSLNLGMLLESVSSLLHILSDLCLIRHNPWLSTFRSTGQCGAGEAESVEPQRTEYSYFGSNASAQVLLGLQGHLSPSQVCPIVTLTIPTAVTDSSISSPRLSFITSSVACALQSPEAICFQHLASLDRLGLALTFHFLPVLGGAGHWGID